MMWRKLGKVAAVGLLALCVAMAGLWVRSYSHADRVHGRLPGQRSFLIASKQGQLLIVGFRWHGADNSWTWDVRTHAVEDMMSFPAGDARQYVDGLGFGIIRQPTYFVMDPVQPTTQGQVYIFGAAIATLNGWGIAVPFWFLFLLSAAVPVGLFIARVRRSRRSRLGHCPTCGYDLRATPERCPECGMVVGVRSMTAG